MGTYRLTLEQQKIVRSKTALLNLPSETLSAARACLQKGESIETIEDLLTFDLSRLSNDHANVIQEFMKGFGLCCNPEGRWISDRIITILMQHLLKCHITEIGIEVKTAEALEEYANVICLNDLMNLKWSELEQFAKPEREGGIPNFGQDKIREIQHCLTQAGFMAPSGTKWICEQDVLM